MERYCLVPTCWGPFTLVTRNGKLLATELPGLSEERCTAFVGRTYPEATYDPHVVPTLQDTVRAYFAGEQTSFRIRLVLDGSSAFRQAVIRACRRIPYGKTCSYGELARRAGHEGAARAVGTVMARNRYPLIVPCHRVVAGGGKLGGFSSSGGLSQKEALLRLEGVHPFDTGALRIPCIGCST